MSVFPYTYAGAGAGALPRLALHRTDRCRKCGESNIHVNDPRICEENECRLPTGFELTVTCFLRHCDERQNIVFHQIIGDKDTPIHDAGALPGLLRLSPTENCSRNLSLNVSAEMDGLVIQCSSKSSRSSNDILSRATQLLVRRGTFLISLICVKSP